jgi:uracil-DNA glycosylase
MSEQPSLFSVAELERPAPDKWAELKAEALKCQKCALHKSRTQGVFGEGNIDHPMVAFVGEAPGYEEDLSGHPFVGDSGKLLNRMLEAMKLDRKELYVCNVLCCRPPGNRDPEVNEAIACHPYLVGQLQLVRPRVIVALGAVAIHQLTGKKDAVGKLRGRWLDWQSIPLRATFHPAYLLRNPPAKKDVWDDLLHVQTKIKELKDQDAASKGTSDQPA